jgi:uncharacterized membrane protein YhaH (DUF805 family)
MPFVILQGAVFFLLHLILGHSACDFYLRIVFPLSCLPIFSLSFRRLRDASCLVLWAFTVLVMPFFLSDAFQKNLLNLLWREDSGLLAFFAIPAAFLVYGALAIGFAFRVVFPSDEDNRYGAKPVATLSSFALPPTFKAQIFQVMIVLSLFSSLWAISLIRTAHEKTTGIVDYRPIEFREITANPFFYTIGNQLKYGESIDADAPTLFSGKRLFFFTRLMNDEDEDRLRVYPSPDNRKAAVVSEEKLYLVRPEKKPALMLEYVDIPGKKLFFGRNWYRSLSLQWDSASRYIYIIRDHELTPKGTKKTNKRYSSRDAVLERIDTEGITFRTEKVLDGFAVHFGKNAYASYFYNYFLVNDSNVCFEEAASKWKCATAKGRFLIQSHDADEILLEDGTRLKGRKFLSVDHHNRDEGFHVHWYCWIRHGNLKTWVLKKPRGERTGFLEKYADLSLTPLDGNGSPQDGLFSRDRPGAPLIILKRFRPPMDSAAPECNSVDTQRSGMLPGERYLFLKLSYFYPIEILLDRQTGRYRELPNDTRVYVNGANAEEGKRLTPADLLPDVLERNLKSKKTKKE